MPVREVTLLAIILRIICAVIIGGLLGLERELKNRPAGMRTYMLVCTGACLIMLTNQYAAQAYGTGDPMRLGAQVVSGIGFLGAGTIIVTRRNQIKGLTTAAGLWTAAGIGLALGIGFYEAALVGGIATYLVMTILQAMDTRLHKHAHRAEIYVEFSQELSLRNFLNQVREKGLTVHDIQREVSDENTHAYVVSVRSPQNLNHEQIVQQVKAIPGVAYLEEL